MASGSRDWVVPSLPVRLHCVWVKIPFKQRQKEDYAVRAGEVCYDTAVLALLDLIMKELWRMRSEHVQPPLSSVEINVIILCNTEYKSPQLQATDEI